MQELIKDLTFYPDCQNKLIEGISKLSRAVKSTYGPYGQTVLIETPSQTKGLIVTKDGVTVAKSIELLDPVENMGARIVKEAADKTATSAGDGTSVSIVLAEALIKGGADKITPNLNKTFVLSEMASIGEKVIDKVKELKLECTDQILLDVAKTSCNNDEKIGSIIAEAYKGVGKDGIVTVEKSFNEESSFEVVDGLKIDRGYSSPMFMNNKEKEEWVGEDVYILMCDQEISSHAQIMGIFETIVKAKKKLLIIAPCTGGFLNAMIHNYLAGNIDVCIITPPNFGYKLQDEMEDIAISVGATYFSEKTGDDLSLIRFDQLGRAAKVTVGRKRTVVVGGHGDKQKIQTRAVELKGLMGNRTLQHEVDYLNQRIATLIGGVGVIYVGGATDIEQKELYDRVDDSVKAVRSALEEGVVCGAGKALWEVQLSTSKEMSEESQVAMRIISEAIKIPLTQILANAELSVEDYYNEDTAAGYGYNLKTGQHGNLISMGVIDPFKVVRCAFQNALSVAITILSTNTSITIQRAC